MGIALTHLWEARIAVILLLPASILLAIFFLWPLVGIVLRSLNADGSLTFSIESFDLVNYELVFSDPTFRGILLNTTIISLEATILSAVLAYPTAYFVARLPTRWSMFVMILILVPFFASIILRLYAFTQILGRQGLLNSVLGLFGVEPLNLLFNRTGTIIGMTAYLLPYMILTLYAIMSRIDQTLITAAKSLGASSWHAFRTIFFPLTRQGLIAGTLLVFILGLGFFLTPAILGGPRDITVAVYIQRQVSLLRWGVASAMGILLLVLTVVLFAAASRLLGSRVRADALSGGRRGTSSIEPLPLTPSSVILGAFAGCTVLFLLLPLLVVVPVSLSPSEFVVFPPKELSLQWYYDFFAKSVWKDAAAKSFITASSVSILASILGLTVAVAVRNARPALQATVEAAIFAPLVVPVILTAIALYDVQLQLHLLGTNIGLILAHAALAMPYSFILLRVALSGTDMSLEEAAWTLGASRLKAFASITLIAIMPSIVSSLALAFLASFDEVVVAIFQTGVSKTLPVLFFSYLQTGAPPTVAAIGTMLIGLAGLCAIGVLLVAKAMRRIQAKTTALRKLVPRIAG